MRLKQMAQVAVSILEEISDNQQKQTEHLSDTQGELESQGVALERIVNSLDQIESHLEVIRRIAERTP